MGEGSVATEAAHPHEAFVQKMMKTDPDIFREYVGKKYFDRGGEDDITKRIREKARREEAEKLNHVKDEARNGELDILKRIKEDAKKSELKRLKRKRM